MDIISLFVDVGHLIFPIGFVALFVLTLIWQVKLRSEKIVIKKPADKKHFAIGLAMMIIGYAGESVCVVLLTITSANSRDWLIVFVFGIVGAVGLVKILQLKNLWMKALIGFLIIFGIFIIVWFITVIVTPYIL